MLCSLSLLAILTLSSAFHPITIRDHSLNHRVYKLLKEVDWLNCIRLCYDDPECFSYNFVRSKNGLGVCQMIDCGLRGVCGTDSLTFTAGAVFQQIVATKGTDICGSSTKTHESQADFSLRFPSPASVKNYVHVERSTVTLSQLSVCFWVKSWKYRVTIFSYIGPRGAKELVIEIYDPNYSLLTIGGETRTLLRFRVNDRKWHHICAVWSGIEGQWSLYKDGGVVDSGTSFRKNYVILPGEVVLGQEPESAKSFVSSRSFVGHLANFNLWGRSLAAIEVLRMSKDCLNGKGDVLKWSQFGSGIKGKVKVIKPSRCAH